MEKSEQYPRYSLYDILPRRNFYVVKKETITFFKKDNVLWLKNNLFGANLNFIGNNTFQLSGSSTESGRKYIFQVTPSGGVELTVASLISDKKETIVWTKNK